MSELWDIYTANGDKTGRTIFRGQTLELGGYHLVVHIWIRNRYGEYLIQKRTDHLDWLPGRWATTGGSAVSGEDSLTAAVRETQEELGLTLHQEVMARLSRVIRMDSIVDIWVAQADLDDLDQMHLGPEVSAVKWASSEVLKDMVASGVFHNYSYFELLP